MNARRRVRHRTVTGSLRLLPTGSSSAWQWQPVVNECHSLFICNLLHPTLVFIVCQALSNVRTYVRTSIDRSADRSSLSFLPGGQQLAHRGVRSATETSNAHCVGGDALGVGTQTQTHRHTTVHSCQPYAYSFRARIPGRPITVNVVTESSTTVVRLGPVAGPFQQQVLPIGSAHDPTATNSHILRVPSHGRR